MTTDQIVLELRAVPGAPERLHARIAALPEPRGRREWRAPRIDIRRTLLVLAPAAVVFTVGAAAVHGLLGSGERTKTAYAPHVVHGGRAGRTLRGENGAHAATTVPAFDAVTRQKVPQALTRLAPNAIPPSATRLNRYQAWVQVQVARDRLSAATTQAMRLARSYGGYVASVDLNTPGRRGRASLVLRVPVTSVQDAVLHLERLGTVEAQHVRIQDLQRQYDLEQQQIVKLRATIARLQEQLKTASPERRVELQYELAQAKSALALKTRVHQKTEREGTLATISVAFTAKHAAAAAPAHHGRLYRTFHGAGGFLVTELAWLLYALIVVAPIALVAAAALYALRVARRTSDRRLLESA